MEPKILFMKAVPTLAQSEAGNYPKRKLQWNDLTISVENEAGSVRKGKGWQTKMLYPLRL
jgi:Inorganic Pyrophosphatase